MTLEKKTSSLDDFIDLDIEVMEDIIAPGLIDLDIGNDASEVVVGRTHGHVLHFYDAIPIEGIDDPTYLHDPGAFNASNAPFNVNFTPGSGQPLFDIVAGLAHTPPQAFIIQDGTATFDIPNPVNSVGFQLLGLQNEFSVVVRVFDGQGVQLPQVDGLGNPIDGGDFRVNQETFPRLLLDNGGENGFIGIFAEGEIASMDIQVQGDDVFVDSVQVGNTTPDHSLPIPSVGKAGMVVLTGGLAAAMLLLLRKQNENRSDASVPG